MIDSLRRCPHCKVQALAASWLVCPRCGASAHVDTALLCQVRTVPESCAPEVQARHPDVDLRTAMRREKRIARHLEMIEAAWLVLRRAGCTWERIEVYLRRRKAL